MSPQLDATMDSYLNKLCNAVRSMPENNQKNPNQTVHIDVTQV